MDNVYLLLGSNEGERELWLTKGTALIADNCGRIVTRSHIYETAAWGLSDQPAFLNQVLEIDTKLSPETLLEKTLSIENALGRQRAVQWGQRTLDVDILFYNNIIVNTPALTIPHAQIPERRFTLMPMSEIAADMIHPILQQSISELLRICPDDLPVNLYNKH